MAISTFKTLVGKALVSVKTKPSGIVDELMGAAKFLEDKELVRYVKASEPRDKGDVTDAWSALQRAALSYYELTGLGEQFVFDYTDEQLARGQFKLPGEPSWYERWFWKLVLPGLVSLIVALLVSYLKK